MRRGHDQRTEPGRVAVSKIEWRWQDSSGGTGHMQAVVGDGEFVRHQTAYRTYFDHASECPECVDGVCPEARRLWRAVKGREEPKE